MHGAYDADAKGRVLDHKPMNLISQNSFHSKGELAFSHAFLPLRRGLFAHRTRSVEGGRGGQMKRTTTMFTEYSCG